MKSTFKVWMQIARAIKHSTGKRYYSETGEDSILFDIFKSSKGYYLDIGAGHPVVGSNTYGLYRRGWTGTGVDLLAEFEPIWRRIRPRDQFQVGALSLNCGKVEYIRFENTLLSSTNSEVIEFHKKRGIKFEKIITDAISMQSLIAEHISSRENFVLNIDVEGSEIEVLQQIDFTRQRPKVICIESWTLPWEATTPVHTLLMSSQYKLYAYTGLNAFYVANEQMSKVRGLRESLAG